MAKSKTETPGPDMRLAMVLQAVEDLDKEASEQRSDYKARREVLWNEACQIKCDILTGQKSIFEAMDDLNVTLAKDGTTATLLDDKSKTIAKFGKGKGHAHV